MISVSCHPERSLAESDANRQAQSKDLVFAESATADEMNFRTATRFFDEHNTEQLPVLSREPVKECSPWRKPSDNDATVCKPRRGERKFRLEPCHDKTEK
ncbi:MAG TPA: hypothetical protein VKQ11_22020 [Candidatus Sulfotelmatobacter sp.]|nr:hypothetical protein [Candidatus Sulfotelmatobacter sp.]